MMPSLTVGLLIRLRHYLTALRLTARAALAPPAAHSSAARPRTFSLSLSMILRSPALRLTTCWPALFFLCRARPCARSSCQASQSSQRVSIWCRKKLLRDLVSYKRDFGVDGKGFAGLGGGKPPSQPRADLTRSIFGKIERRLSQLEK